MIAPWCGIELRRRDVRREDVLILALVETAKVLVMCNVCKETLKDHSNCS